MVQVQRESRDEALHRLADQAAQRGVQVYHYAPAGEYYAPSLSRPGELHRLTLWSCDCRGFVRHQRCQHYAALLALTGNLPTEPTPPASAVARVPEVSCHACKGHGQVRAENRAGRIEVMTCYGTGVEAAMLAA